MNKGPTLHPCSLTQNICLKLLFEGDRNLKDVYPDQWQRESEHAEWQRRAKAELGKRYGRLVANCLSKADHTDDQMDARLTKANKALDRAKKLLADLCDALGLEEHKRNPQHALWAIEAKIHDLREDRMVADLRNQVRGLTHQFDKIKCSPLMQQDAQR